MGQDFSNTWLGYDNLMKQLFGNRKDDWVWTKTEPSYPPYNIVQDDPHKWTIEVAVAGFTESDLSLTLKDGVLSICSKKQSVDARKYTHRGIAKRDFVLNFSVNDNIVISKTKLDNGVLIVELEQENTEEKNYYIPIGYDKEKDQKLLNEKVDTASK